MNIPFSPPDLTQIEIDAVAETLRSGWITTGPRTKSLEARFAEYMGNKRSVCLNSGTAAMEIPLLALGVGEGDEVITSAYTYSASASVAAHVGAKIVLVDTAPDSYEMDYDKLRDAITEKTKVIIPVDIAGVICDYDKIFEIVEEKKHLFKPNNERQAAYGRVIVLADGAHSFGAKRNGIISGHHADITAFSLHAVKNLTTAEGGITTWKEHEGIDSDELYTDMMLWALHGQSKDALAKSKAGAWEYDIIYLGQKCNMTDIMASIGHVQLDRYDELLKQRRAIYDRYVENLKDVQVDLIEHYGDNFDSCLHLLLTRVKGATAEQRNGIIVKMGEAGIGTNVHYKPLPMFTAYKNIGFDINDYPNAYAQYTNEVTLPLHTLLTEEMVDYVCDNYKRVIAEVMGR